MDYSLLSPRQIMGMYFARLETNPGLAWINGVSNLFNSDQASETYAFLDHTPQMQRWKAGRQAKGMTGNSLIIPNYHYEATLEFSKTDLRRDKTNQIRARVEEFADASADHWGLLLSDLIAALPSTVGYDGEYFFDTDHPTPTGGSGNQSNDISVDISAMPAAVHGSVTSPSMEEMQAAIIKGIAQILSFRDKENRPMNPGAREFLVLVPVGLYLPAVAAVSTLAQAALQNNMNPNLIAGLKIDVQMDPRSTWTDSFAVFRTDAPIKALIRQSEQDVELKAKAEGSDFEFDNDAWQFGVDAWRGTGPGYWQRACYVTMT